MKYTEIYPLKGTVVIIHGMAEHSNRYLDFSQAINKLGMSTLLVDLPGHGEANSQSKGHMESTHQIISQLHKQIESCPRPHIIFGHSMGSLVARTYFYKHPESVDALLLSGCPYKPMGFTLIRPALKLFSIGRKTKPAFFIDKLLNDTLAKSLPKGSSNTDWLSFNAQNIQDYKEDPFCGFPLTYQGYNVLFDLFYEVYIKHQQDFTAKIPCLFLIGEKDPCPDFERDGFNKAISRLQSHIQHPIATKIYHNSRHELLNDNEKETVCADILSFLSMHFL